VETKFTKRVTSVILLVASMVSLSAVGAGPVAAFPGAGRASVSADVEREMSASSGSMVSVIVRFRQQADVHRRRTGTRQDRQRSLIDEMKTVANATQRPVDSLLTTRRREGRVGKYEALWVINGLSVTASPDVIDELSRRTDVESITSDTVDIVPSTLPPVPATASADSAVINAPTLWSQGFYGQGVVIADLDTGVDATHPDLSGSYRGGSNSWFDPYGQHSTPTDLSGHGTATTGIIVGGDSSGVTIGVAPGAKWIAAKIFNDAGTATATAIHQAMQWVLDPDGNPATADAPQVVNNSWAYGTPGCNLQFQPDLQAMRAAGIIPVFAAGNYGPGTGTSVSPANYPEALAVGSTDNTDFIDPGTSVGPSACGEASTTYPDLVAPGYNIYTTDLHGFYQWGSGTSFAAPHVTGALALLLSAQPSAGASVEAALSSSAVDLGVVGADNIYGHGRIDAAAALQLLQSPPPPPTTTTTTVPPTTTTTTVPPTATTTTVPPTATTTTVPPTATTTTVPPTATTTTVPPTTTTTLPASPPVAAGLVINPNASSGSTAVTVNATVTADAALSVARAEFFVDSVGAPGGGRAMGGTFGAATSSVSATLTSGDLGALAEGIHTISVLGQDSTGAWSPAVTGNLLIDRTGPTFTSMTLSPSSAVAGGVTTVTATIAGATDGSGSGLAGGEYWIGTTAPTPGSGTAFTGLALILSVSSPAAGNYTVSVRLRDAIGNWGGTRSATLTVSPPIPPGFSDGFESGTLPGAWSSRSTSSTTRLAVATNAALVGAYGLRAQGNDTNYVQYNFTRSAPVHDARFAFRPNLNQSSSQVILAAATSSSFSNTVYRIRYRLIGSTPQVQIQVGTTNTNAVWSNLAGGSTTNTIEVLWQAVGSAGSAPGTLTLIVNGVRVQSLGTTSTAAPASIRLGSVSNGSSSIIEYFDAFASTYSEPAVLPQQLGVARSRPILTQSRWFTSRYR
jgi:subtilisin family serine protease